MIINELLEKIQTVGNFQRVGLTRKCSNDQKSPGEYVYLSNNLHYRSIGRKNKKSSTKNAQKRKPKTRKKSRIKSKKDCVTTKMTPKRVSRLKQKSASKFRSEVNHKLYESRKGGAESRETPGRENLNRLRTKKMSRKAGERSAKKVKLRASIQAKNRQVVLNSQKSKVKSKNTSIRRKKIKRRSENGSKLSTSVKKRHSRLKSESGVSMGPEELRRVKEKMRRIQVVPKDSLEISDFLENPSNIYKRIRGKVEGKGASDSESELQLYAARRRTRSKKKKAASRVSQNQSRKKSLSKKKRQRKQIILNIANRKVAKIKSKISKQIQMRRAEELFKTRKNYFSTNSKTNHAEPVESTQSPKIFNLYNHVNFEDLDRQPRDTKSTLKNIDPHESSDLAGSSRKILRRLMQARDNGAQSEEPAAEHRRKRRESHSLQVDSIMNQVRRKVKEKEAQLESIAEKGNGSSPPHSKQRPRARPGQNDQEQLADKDKAEESRRDVRRDGAGRNQNECRANLTKVKSKIFYKKLALIQFKFMNPEKLRTREFLKILKDLQEIKRMPTYSTDAEFRLEIQRMQVLFAWHLLTRRLENLGKWKTNRAFSFLKIKQCSEVVGNRAQNKHSFRNEAIVQKMGNGPQARDPRGRSEMDFQQSGLETNRSIELHPRHGPLLEGQSKLRQNASCPQFVSQELFQKEHVDCVLALGLGGRLPRFRPHIVGVAPSR